MAYSTRVYSTMEYDLNAAIDGILSGYLSNAEGRVEEIAPMTVNLEGRGDRQQNQIEGRRREGSSEEEYKIYF